MSAILSYHIQTFVKDYRKMEKRKRWQLFVIVAVVLLTIYNILPTMFYYGKSLKDPIDAAKANKVSKEIVSRVGRLEKDSQEWIKVFCRYIGIKPVSVKFDENRPGEIVAVFKNSADADTFRSLLPGAGEMIPFAPAKVGLTNYDDVAGSSSEVAVQRRVTVHLDPGEVANYFTYAQKFSQEGVVTESYRDIVFDRVQQLALYMGGVSRPAQSLEGIIANDSEDEIVAISKDIVEFHKTFGDKGSISKRYYASFTQNFILDRNDRIDTFISLLANTRNQIVSRIGAITKEQELLKAQGHFLDPKQEQTLKILEGHSAALSDAKEIVRGNASLFKAGVDPLGNDILSQALNAGFEKISSGMKLQSLDISDNNSYIREILVDWDNDEIILVPHKDIVDIRDNDVVSEMEAFIKDGVNRRLIGEIAYISHLTEESFRPKGDTFTANLNILTGSSSFLVFNLDSIAKKRIGRVYEAITTLWNPEHPDLQSDVFPIWNYTTYKGLAPEEQQFGIFVVAPVSDIANESVLRDNSIYVVAKGFENIFQKYRDVPNSAEAKMFMDDFQDLQKILRNEGFIVDYSGEIMGKSSGYSKDYIFEMSNYYDNILKATRESFSVHGSKKYALLEFTDVEQRLRTVNDIDNSIHEDLLKWRDEYNSAQVSMDPMAKYNVPPLVKNPFWENVKLGVKKYFRGDDRKILKWGLDLSGGKTVVIGLRDQNNNPVTNEADLALVVNELTERVNKMGVSEVSIRIEGNTVVMDFPGSQGLSASELIKASAMYFHIVNEQFSHFNPVLGKDVDKFLLDVWNEAVVTNRTDVDSVNEIAWKHLGGDISSDRKWNPRSENAKTLYENGLRLPSPKDASRSNEFNDIMSMIAMYRGDDVRDWHGQSHPLLITFNNYALEGSLLENVHTGYDPADGNFLVFGVESSYHAKEGHSGNPRSDFYAWTAQFSQDKIPGTQKEVYSQGRGWRMAVILNGVVVSDPSLKAALRSGGTISGNFTQREIMHLSSDLKAGSLSFTPRILSEKNISPELGHQERDRGIFAAVIGLVFVILAMVIVYKFSGVVASVAVLFNLLIMWGVLQNLDAALTLPGIAGIILTIGMAVDANVLVFERIREEFAVSKRIGVAVQAGYRKALSAIMDSNVTTIIAALVLVQFDSGPIKGFAVTLIVGIASSMFTALFMTRYFFAGWIRGAKNRTLNMRKLIGKTTIDFLGKAKLVMTCSLVLIVVGGAFLYIQRHSVFGMDFTGGYALTVDIQEQSGIKSYRSAVKDALKEQGLAAGEFQVRELNKPNHIRIQLARALELPGKAFHQMPEKYSEGKFIYDYEQNPRIVWVLDALDKGGLSITTELLPYVDQDWTNISGQFSNTMRNNAILGLGFALLCILIYITLRFEFKYAISAIICLGHDVLVTLGVIAILNRLGLAIQIDLQVIGAIMTIIGYSLNDTIIIFDRIREDSRLLRKLKFSELINHALNITLSRTVMTSLTTLLVLVALVVFGGTGIFDFAFVMALGVIFGTISSLFVASPVMFYFHNREVAHQKHHSKKA